MNVREEKLIVKAHQCHPNGYMKIFSLMQHMQEIATLHAEDLGFGFTQLNKTNHYWVLINLRIEFSKTPKWNDKILLKTWPSGHSRVMATREFIGIDENNHELFKAGSQWMILSKGSNRPKNLFNLNLGLPEKGQQILSGKMKRLELKNHFTHVEQIYVPYNSIDLNGHVNNTEYIQWAINTLRKVYKFDDKITWIQATYFSEVFENDELELLVASSNNCYSVLIKKPNSDNAVFLMEICSYM